MSKSIVPVDRIAQSISLLRGQKVMLDSDLAALYGVTTKVLNQAVKRNRNRFPDDFMFRLNADEVERLISQFGTSNAPDGPRTNRSRSQIVTLRRGQNIKYLPYVFTEQGVAMLSSVLNSKRAGERTRPACGRWRPRHRELFLSGFIVPSRICRRAFRRGRRKEHARRVCSPIR
jgi:hypothetical protein